MHATAVPSFPWLIIVHWVDKHNVKPFLTLVKDSKEDCSKGATSVGFCCRGKRLGSTQYKDKWEFIAKELGGSQWIEND